MASRVRIGIIGAGIISRVHMRAYTAMADSVEMVALVETDPARREAASRQHSIPVLADFGAVLENPAIDLIDICTPPATHEDIVLAALASGKYVVCEKPLAPTLAGIDRILELARDHQGRLATVHQYRTMPEIRQMIRLRDAGDLGDLLVGQFSRYDRVVGGPADWKGWWGEWKTAGGGVGMTQFIHYLDLMCLLFGRPVEVAGMMGTIASSIESEDTLSAAVRFEGEAIVSGSATMAGRIQPGFRVDVFGSRGSVHYPWALHAEHRGGGRLSDLMTSWRFRMNGSTNLLARGLRRARRSLPIGTRAESNHAKFLKLVVDAMRAGRPLPVPPEEARRPVELCTAIYASALSGRSVTLPLSPASPYYRGISAAAYRGAREGRGPQQSIGGTSKP
jgi:predicted dehydrogenase